ncbi:MULTISPECIES: polyphosphate kinase 2 [Methylomonas]|uniref:ADP/GDP-polyphosphate phosphotransferase n=1 Tax=Methylomonas koyamae TaxID=702114 RepID=A0A177NJP9_9GAMM|nr:MULTISPECIES: polyphosphate kinase 2 [Methylomonas]OAI18346.1 polyphosphate kinase 2 [Methylomonas koyamae]OHX36067.1 polyphosphate kinase 2 [Methylomonas sp. LWB]
MGKKKSERPNYKDVLRQLQVELVKLQSHIIKHGDKILILFEGRDAGGKDGTIKRIIQHLSPRETRVVALGKPSDRDLGSWYFQRYTEHLPAAQEMVLFNRSWYNRAGVERVMGFCSDADYHEFIETVAHYEQLLVRSGIKLFKYYLDISKEEQKKRLKARLDDPLKQWKISPIDKAAQKHWRQYSEARNIMFARTHHLSAPWTVVRADDKQAARVNIIKDLLSRLDYKGRDEELILPDGNVVFNYEESYLHNGMIAP